MNTNNSVSINTAPDGILEYLDSNPNASIYHLPQWGSLIKEIFGHDTYYFTSKSQDKIQGVLPLTRLKSWIFGDYMVSMPYFNYGGVLSDNSEAFNLLVNDASYFAQEHNISHIEFRDTWSYPKLRQKLDKISMLLPLPDKPEDLWDTFKPKLRSQIRRPSREGINIKQGGIELLDSFYNVFCTNMRDLGTPVYPKKFFATILNFFPNNSRIFVVCLGNIPIASGFLIGYKDKMEIPWASSLRSHNKIGANMALYWAVLQYSIQEKYSVFDFGRCSKNSGTYKFKKQWGAREKQLYWHYWLPDNDDLPNLNPNNPKYKLAIETWKKLPVSFANWLGPKIVKNLP